MRENADLRNTNVISFDKLPLTAVFVKMIDGNKIVVDDLEWGTWRFLPILGTNDWDYYFFIGLNPKKNIDIVVRYKFTH